MRSKNKVIRMTAGSHCNLQKATYPFKTNYAITYFIQTLRATKKSNPARELWQQFGFFARFM